MGKPTPEERFWTRVEKTPTCWIWLGRKSATGYGQFDIGNRTEQAHRWAYKRYIGPIPDDLPLDHLCRNRACVNYERCLEPVTSWENTHRSPIAPAAVNARKTHCPKGHPYDATNTRWYRHVGGWIARQCWTCRRKKGLASYHRNKTSTWSPNGTHCRNGHLMDEANTEWLTEKGRRRRRCRTCRQAAWRRYERKTRPRNQ